MQQVAQYVKYPPEEFARGPIRRGSVRADVGETWQTASAAQRTNRTQMGYRGQGAYYGGRGGFGTALRKFWNDPWLNEQKQKVLAVGRNLGSQAMDRALMAGQEYAHSAMAGGQGDYDMNALVEGGASSSGFVRTVPEFGPNPDDMGGIIISHKEYLTDVYGNEAADEFVNNSWALNPGIEKTFPWLSQFAQNFEEYTMHQLMFTYRATISNDLSTSNGQVGTIIMVVDYNPDNTPFIDKGTMMQYAGAVSSKVTNTVCCGVECDPGQNSGVVGQYVRYMPVLQGQDLKMYDRGTFQLALSGTPDAFVNQPIGELWVSYTVALRKPRLTTGLGLAISTDYFIYTAAPYFNMNNLAEAPIVPALQNNIGCDLLTTLTNSGGINYFGLGVRFPAYASSYYEIDMTYVPEGTWAHPLSITNTYVPFGDVQQTILNGYETQGFMSKKGNIMFLNDLPPGVFATGNGTITLHSGAADGYLTWKCHCKPGQALGEDDNVVWFYFSNLDGTWSDLIYFALSIKEYSIMGNLNKVPTAGAGVIPTEIAFPPT